MSDDMAVLRNRPHPEHWYSHYPEGGGVEMCLAADFLNRETQPLDNPASDDLIQMCGSCGHHFKAFHSEWCGESDSFKEIYCPSCFNANFRKTSVVATKRLADDLTVERIQRYIQNRFDKLAWMGKIADVESHGPQALIDELPDDPEIAKYPLVSIDIDWDILCPACGVKSENTEFDFHHWDYENDIGCRLCRECHEHLHRGKRAFEQTKDMGKEWQRDAVPRLHEHAVSNGLGFNDAVEFAQRFNIPKGSTAQKATSELFMELADSVPITEYIDGEGVAETNSAADELEDGGER